MKKPIIEKTLGITGDYQYSALRSKNFLQANWHSNKLSVLSRVIKKYKPKRILDLGTGSGNFELAFADQIDSIVGVDYNDEALSFLKEKLKKRKIANVKLVNDRVENIGNIKKIGRFDMIILIDVIEHIEKRAGEKMIADFKKMLTKEGVVVIVTPNYFGLWPLIEKAIDKFTSIPNLENMQHVTKFNPKSLKNAFEKNNYKTLEATTFNTFSYLVPSKDLSKKTTLLETKMKLPFGNLLFYIFKLRQ